MYVSLVYLTGESKNICQSHHANFLYVVHSISYVVRSNSYVVRSDSYVVCSLSFVATLSVVLQGTDCSSTLCDVIEKSRAISCLAACNIGNASSKHEEMLSGVTDVISADFQFLHSILRPANTLHSNCRWCKHKANSLKANVSNESLFLNAALGSVDES